MKEHQNGFSIIEGLLILVIIGILGFTGWYVWHSKNNTDKTLGSAVSTSNSVSSTKNNSSKAPAVQASDYAGWKTYTNSQYGISLKHPSNWNVQSSISAGELVLNITPLTNTQTTYVQNNPASTTYNNDLQLSVIVSKTTIGGYSTIIDKSLGSIQFNGKDYPLIDDVSQVMLMNCKTNMDCTNWVPTSHSGSIDIRIASVNIRHTPSPQVNTSSSEYETAYLVLKSINF